MPRHCQDQRKRAIYEAFPADRFHIDGPAVGLTAGSLKGATRKDRIGLNLAWRMAAYRPSVSVEGYLGRSLPRVRVWREFKRVDLARVASCLAGHVDADQRRAFNAALMQVCDEYGVPVGGAPDMLPVVPMVPGFNAGDDRGVR